MSDKLALQQELETYQKALPGLIDKAGKYVLIKGDAIIGTFDSYADALSAGYEKFALTPFMVKCISPTEQVAFFTRDLRAACPA